MIRALAAKSAKGSLEAFEYDPGPLKDEQVEIAVEYSGLCHSDLSMLDNDWGMTSYPFVPGHEVVGKIVAVGPQVRKVALGQRVGLGWFSQSCMSCRQCLSGNQNLCPTAEQTIVSRHGGFANRVRCHWAWAVPVPDALDPAVVGPLFCGGLTAFNPFVQFDVRPTDRVGVVGIGGLGHLALQFANKWGCDVTAFSSNPAKTEEAKQLGAHHVVNSRSDAEMKKLAGSLDMILVTANVPLNWDLYLNTLSPRGRLHFVGAVLEPLSLSVMPMILGQKTVSGSPLGSIATTEQLLAFCARHGIKPVVEPYAMSQINDALEHLRAGKARYRIVLKNDLGA